MTTNLKRCTTCKIVKPAEAFSRHSEGYLHSKCGPCEVKRSAEYRRTHKEEHVIQERRRRLGINQEQYETLLLVQGGTCGICGRSIVELSKGLAVDHDHITGAVRGLLCAGCNSAIGMMADSPVRLQAAIEWLQP